MGRYNSQFHSIPLIVLIICVIWTEVNSQARYFSNTDFKEVFNGIQYLIQPAPTICLQNPFLVILVTSSVSNIKLRNCHRRVMPKTLLAQFNAVRVFLLASIPKTVQGNITQEDIQNESKSGDILQGSFLEHYRNLTIKNLMGLRWAALNCINAKFILKVDDDAVFVISRTYDLLSTLYVPQKDRFLMGYIKDREKLIRMRKSKHYVSIYEYEEDFYPQFLSGLYYVTTPETAYRITRIATDYPYLYVDDIFITGILRKALNITLRQLPTKYVKMIAQLEPEAVQYLLK